MAITSLDDYIASVKQKVSFVKTSSNTAVAGIPFSVFDRPGNPSAGTLAVGNTTTGVVPTDATTGYPAINSFAGGAKGYVSAVEFGNTVASRLYIADCVFSAGAFAFNASAVTLSSQPSYASRMPDGSYNGTGIWIEAATAFTGNPTITVTYTNQDGVTGRSTGAVATGAALTISRMVQLPLQAGDTGVQTIESVTCTVATAGTFNVHVLRPIWVGRCRLANDGDSHDMLRTGLPEVFDTSALRLVVYGDGTATGIPELLIEIASK